MLGALGRGAEARFGEVGGAPPLPAPAPARGRDFKRAQPMGCGRHRPHSRRSARGAGGARC